MSRYEDGYPVRGRAADYYTYSRGGAAPPPAYPDVVSPGPSAYSGTQPPRLTYEPQGPYEPPRSPSSRSRPRSLAAPAGSKSRSRAGERGDNKYGDSDDSDDGRTRTPMEKAKRFADNTFTNSTTGLGVGVLGALVGGLAAREAVDLTSNWQHQKQGGRGDHRDRREEAEQHKRNQLLGAVVGAAVGALGANAVEKRIEARRARDDREQLRWERKWRRPEGEQPEVLEKIDVVARPRSRGYSRGSRRRSHGNDDWDMWDDVADRERGGSAGGKAYEREVDPAARSWKDVEDWRMATG
ncbi:hypothetical protein F4777DRAFT_538778 [Nemania sp. FL0916]|nr:hypothetical protein F4777DRAFT_538778 [Nemania sp. FL0916]